MTSQRCSVNLPSTSPQLRADPCREILKRSKAAPRGLQATFCSALEASTSAPRALPEAFRSHHAAKLQSEAILCRFRPPKSDPRTSNFIEISLSLKSIEKTHILFEEIVFSAQVASWPRFWTLLAPLLGAFWPPRSLKPVLECLLERPRAVQEHFFRPR